MATPAEQAAAIIKAIDVNMDSALQKTEMIAFFEGLKVALSMPANDPSRRPSEEEADDLIKSFGDAEKGEIPAAKFEEFLVGFCTEDAEKAKLVLEGMAKIALHSKMLARVRDFDGFLAALDQSGGSTPKALKAYGVTEDMYSGDDAMFDMVHQMRTRIVTSAAFSGEHVLGAILFEMTMDREFEGMPAAQYLWENKNVVPFVKCDKGLAEEADDCQLMKPMPQLDELMVRAKAAGVFGTKMRSLIKKANEAGIKAVVAQQFEVGRQIIGHGLCPIIEPEVDIHSETKAEAEALLKASMLEELNKLDVAKGELVMLKLSLPTVDGFYTECIEHPAVVKVVALSGGYSRDEANERLAKQPKMVASFSRALTEGLSAQQSDDEFNSELAKTIEAIHKASST